MADVVTSQTIEDGNRNLVMRFTNLSDGTGETGVVKVNATSQHGIVIGGNTIYPGINLKIVKVKYDIIGMALRIQWVSSSNTDALILNGAADHLSFKEFGGIPVPAGLSGATGSIAFTTVGAANNSSYTVVLYMTKGIPQS